MNYRIAKGVYDLLPKDPDPSGTWREMHLWHYLEARIQKHVHNYGYQEIRTPLFETTELFTRSIGRDTDIVNKEMYTFHDKAGRQLTLRPEGTAPVMRAFIEKHLANQSSVHKFFYILPMFRYERQQAGRYRQHRQFGIEAIGNASPLQDAECIELLYTLLTGLGLQGLTLHLNSIGDAQTRTRYRSELKKALHPHLEKLTEESQQRFHTNPLRILDSKHPHDRKVLEQVPDILTFLSDEEQAHFAQVRAYLESAGIPYTLNPSLVRGLDYYNRTVFEITANELGAQNSLGGGGRYDGLIEELGGPPLPAFGFGAGLERILQTLLAQGAPLPAPRRSTLYLIALGDEAKGPCFELACRLRRQGIAVEMDYSEKKLQGAMRNASKSGATYVAVLGAEELASGQVTLKALESGEKEIVEINQLETKLR